MDEVENMSRKNVCIYIICICRKYSGETITNFRRDRCRYRN